MTNSVAFLLLFLKKRKGKRKKNYNSVLENDFPRPRKIIVGENIHVNSMTFSRKSSSQLSLQHMSQISSSDQKSRRDLWNYFFSLMKVLSLLSLFLLPVMFFLLHLEWRCSTWGCGSHLMSPTRGGTCVLCRGSVQSATGLSRKSLFSIFL